MRPGSRPCRRARRIPFSSNPVAGEVEMDRAHKRDLTEVETEPMPDRESLDEDVLETQRRQKAAAYLRAARLTDDAGEREALRRKAGELLSSRAFRRRRPSAR